MAHGLSRHNVNGRCGAAISFDSATGRYLVHLLVAQRKQQAGQARAFRLKPANLMRDLNGQRVVTHGLSRQDVNDRRGTVLTFDPSTGRYAVRLEPGKEKFKLKPENIRLDMTEPLRRATKAYPLEALRSVIREAGDSEVEVEPQALADAHERLVKLATEELEAVMHRRQLEPLNRAPFYQAVAKAEEEGLVGEAVMMEARALLAELEIAPPGAAPAPAGKKLVGRLGNRCNSTPLVGVVEPTKHEPTN